MRYKKRIKELRRCVRLGLWLMEMLKNKISGLEVDNASLKDELKCKQDVLDKHYANTERLWQWARENLTGETSDQFWHIAANGHLMHENPVYHLRINDLKYLYEESEKLRSKIMDGMREIAGQRDRAEAELEQAKAKLEADNAILYAALKRVEAWDVPRDAEVREILAMVEGETNLC